MRTAPQTVDRAAIAAAAERIAGHARLTPVLTVDGDIFGADAPVVLKLELTQHSGSFKARGAFNRILSNDVPRSGVVAASGGNAGAAVAYAARKLRHHAEVFVPQATPKVKIDRLRAFGAEVFIGGAGYADALVASDLRRAETGALSVHAYDQPEVVAGQGTVAAELSVQAPELDTVLVAVGGGGLIAGVATWMGTTTRVVAVEPIRAPTLHAALAAGEPVDVDVGGAAADSLGARRIGAIAWAVAQSLVDRSVLVPDEAIMDARRRLWDHTRVAAEPGGACALAAITSGAYRPSPGERVGLIVCGGNTDPASLAS